MILSRFWGLNRNGPTNPLVACERCDVFPLRKCFRRSDESLLQICRYDVDGPRRYLHTEMIALGVSAADMTDIFRTYSQDIP